MVDIFFTFEAVKVIHHQRHTGRPFYFSHLFFYFSTFIMLPLGWFCYI